MGRRSFVIALATASCAFVAVPATAGAACTNWNNYVKVKSYSGTASTSYVSGTLTGPPAGTDPNTATVSIDRSATNLQLKDLTPPSYQADFENLSQPTGGTVTVNDSYSDQTGSERMTGSGPTKAGGDGNGAQIITDANKCTYQVSIGFLINTTTVITGVEETDTGVADGAETPMLPIPSNLVLKGSVTIPASADGATSGNSGLFDMSGDPVWGENLDYVTGGKPEGIAKITWDLEPTGASSGCTVPKVSGLSEKSAASKLKSAGCKVGKVSKSHSSKVAKGKVVSSKPKSGSKEKSGTKVSLVVSSGK
jgi:PASTA domain